MTDSSFGWNIVNMPEQEIDNTEQEEVCKTTNRLLEMVEDHVIRPYDAVLMCLKWMGEDEVAEMCKVNGIFPEDTEDEED